MSAPSSMNGSWYSIVQHATVIGDFSQTGSTVTGSLSWSNYGIGSFTWTVSGSVTASTFALVGTSSNSGPFPSKAKFTGQIVSDSYGPGLAVSTSPFGSFMFRPNQAFTPLHLMTADPQAREGKYGPPDARGAAAAAATGRRR